MVTPQRGRPTLSQFELFEVGEAHWPAVRTVVAAAFDRADEADLVEELRAQGAVVLELAAMENRVVIGHVLFSTLEVEPRTRRIAALAPLSVAPEWQRHGVGSALVREGLARCATLGFDAVAVLGDPEYYRRFGFRRRTARALESVYSGLAYQALELKPGALLGGPWRATYSKAFG
jgi:putative acetyltransferase